MIYYRILNKPEVLEFASGLEDEIFPCIGYKDKYIILDTCDGELLFKPNEVEKIKNRKD